MIDFVFAAEFDLLKGSLIKGVYPQPTQGVFDEEILSGYMIPDGSHKREWDCNNFRYISDFKKSFMKSQTDEFNKRKFNVNQTKKNQSIN
jgi:hypothetical protein